MAAETWEPLEYVEMVDCPVCGAQRGELCEWREDAGSNAHVGRVNATLQSLAVSQTDG